MTTATSSSDRYAEAREALAHWQAVEDGHRIDAQAASEKIATALRALITPPATEETAEQITDAAMEKFAARVPPSDTVGFAAQIIRGALEDAVRAGIRAAWESWEGEVAKGATGPALLKMFAYDFAEWWESDEANDAQDIVSAQESFADNWWAEFTA